jgi:Tol biopolymer transport system component
MNYQEMHFMNNFLRVFKVTRARMCFLCMGFSAFFLTSCASSPQPTPEAPTGLVTAINQQFIVDEETGKLSVVAERIEEIAARSVIDTGALSLVSTQRVVDVGRPFSSYQVSLVDNKIVATVFNQEGKNGSDIWTFGIGESGRTRITKTNYFNNSPAFSSDGRYIYFSSTRSLATRDRYDQASYIWRMSASGGSGVTRIGTPVFDYEDVFESPGRDHLLYTALEFYENSSFIWYSEANGTLPTQLTQGKNARWVSDDRISFSSQDVNTGLYSIWTVNIDGTELTQLITDVDLDCISPSPSTDGKYIAYVKEDPEGNETSRDIYIYSMETGLSQQITTNSSRDDMPQWSGSSDSLFFRSTRGVGWSIWRINALALDL